MTEEKLVEEILEIASELDRGDITFAVAQIKAQTLVRIDRYEQLTIPVVSGSYYWVKLMTDDKHEPAMAINLLGVMNFQFFNGVAVPCDKVNDYSECNYR
jgi:hypothetical protein